MKRMKLQSNHMLFSIYYHDKYAFGKMFTTFATPVCT